MGSSCRITASDLCRIFSLFFFISFSLTLFCDAADTITKGQSITDGQTIISSAQNFTLGFFSPQNSTLRYIGIWYSKIPIQTIVWVANREKPISGAAGLFTIQNDGNLEVLDGNGYSVWSSNVSVSLSNTTSAILTDTGNLILSSSEDLGNPDKAYWQSFNDATDTYLSGMRVRVNRAMGENRFLTSWRTANDPSPGNYTMGVDPRGSPQIVIWQGLKREWRSGHWNGLKFMGVPSMMGLYQYGFKLSPDDGNGNTYFTYTSSNTSYIMRFRIRWDGIEEQLRWDDGSKRWIVMQNQPDNECGEYNKCGDFGICTITNSPICSCIDGFEPRYEDQWNRGNWSGGCVRKTQLQCERNSSNVDAKKGDGFLQLNGVKLPDFTDIVVAGDLKECEAKCLMNCSCKGYAFVQFGIGCTIWSEDLVDVQHFSEEGKTLYVRVAYSELGGNGKISNFVIIAIVVGGVVVLSVTIWLLWRFRAKVKAFSNSWRKSNDRPMLDISRGTEFSTDFSGPDALVGDGKEGSGPELQLFTFNFVATATNNFSKENKLGQGGFGPVYKGNLPGGQEIAVKRLSRKSGQGLEEFKNEIKLIAKLQHRNLVRLLGCCIEGEEKMVLYEYMPNKSLDFFLFDPEKQALLDWRARFAIIEGIARGLLYLHRDSRLRIIHRDLKASNILLDEEMTPKISDFGMARIFGGNQDEANTIRVVGTYGYMAPEYAMEGLFSVKSDVYSFGVLLLEIVSGRRNISFRLSEHSNLIGYAWNLWNEGKSMELVHPCIKDSCSQNEVLRCIHVGMLCVQDSAVYRPTMPSVVLMLESDSVNIPRPRQPTFTSIRSDVDIDMSIEAQEFGASNDVTVSTVVGR